MTPKKLGPKSFIKIGPVASEILLIWTNVTRAYVAWTNVTITVDIFLTCLVKIGSVTAEIFLIWTYVAWTNVAWTKVTVTVD